MSYKNSGHIELHGHVWFGPTVLLSRFLGLRILAPKALAAILALTLFSLPSRGGILKRDKDAGTYGEGLIVNIPLPEPEVAQVVDDVAQNTIIHGSKEYNKDEYIAGAAAAASTPLFPAWTEGGKVFYKVRKLVLDPLNFKDAADVGTLAVRYVVQPQGDKNTVLRIDALYSEDYRHSVHQSNGTVESSEYKDIHDKLDAIELMKKEDALALQAKQERLASKKFGLGDASSSSTGMSSSRANANANGNGNGSDNANDTVTLSTPPAAAADNSPMMAPPTMAPGAPVNPDGSPQTLEQHVAELRRQVERLVKKPGAPLKSAPFHTASTLKSLLPGSEVLIVISTPYWFGVETHEGEHGWLRRDDLEQVP